MPGRITSADIRRAMAKVWAAPQYALMWEVGEATGAKRGRYADAVIMSLWPSRGLELHGVEIKISRADWRVEAKDPTKAEAIAKYCDRWWLHTAPGVVADLSELPPAWGLREFDGKSWTTVREAEKTDASQIDRAFLAALLRRADGVMRALVDEAVREGRKEIDAQLERDRERFSREVALAAERRTREATEKVKSFERFCEAFGEDALSGLFDQVSLGRAARMISDAATMWSTRELARNLRGAADIIDAIKGTSAGGEG